MTYVPGHEYDVFVSYADIDNDVVGSGGGWVDTFLDKFISELAARIGLPVTLAPAPAGPEDVRLWVPRAIEGNRPRADQVLEAADKAATLVVVMSRAYLNAEWCQAWLRRMEPIFRRHCKRGSLFILNLAEVSQAERPLAFGDVPGFKFWARDEQSGADRRFGGGDRHDSRLAGEIFRVSHKLCDQLRQLKAGPTAVASAASRPMVYLALATEDLEDRERDVRAHLEQYGMHVLPNALYPRTSVDEFKNAMRRDIEQCSVFVQLVSAVRGRAEFDPPVRLPWLQHVIAEEVWVQNPRLQILTWRPKTTDMSPVGDHEHHALLDAARVCGIEELKREAVEAARRKPPDPIPQSDAPMVYVSADRPDRALADEIAAFLLEHNVGSLQPLDDSPDEALRDFTTNLSQCDGFLLVYGKTQPDWVRGRLLHSRRSLAAREHGLPTRAIYRGPPPEKPDLRMALPGLLILEGRHGLDVGVLREFLDRLKK